jgi:hypothetical protein
MLWPCASWKAYSISATVSNIVALAKKSWSRATFRIRFLGRTKAVEPTVMDDYALPPHKIHSNLDDPFIPLADAARLPGVGAPANNTGICSTLRVSRLLNEMRQIVIRGPSATYDVYVSENDMAFWLAIMQGPNGTSYEGPSRCTFTPRTATQRMRQRRAMPPHQAS